MLTPTEVTLLRAALAALRVRYVESGHVPPSEIDDVADKLALLEPRIPLAKAAQRLGVHQDSLRRAVLDGRLEAEKIGRNWQTTWSAIQDALAAGIIRGPKTQGGKKNE